MSRLRSLAIVAAAALALCALTGTAAAKTTRLSPVADCQAHNGTLTRSYTLKQLEAALKRISPSVREYTTCNAAISDAINAKLDTEPINPPGSGSGGGGSGTLILIIVIVLVIVVGGGGAYWAYRRNQAGTNPGPGPGPGDPV